MQKYKKISNILLCIGGISVILAVGFLCYALGHPEASFPWGLEITYLIYAMYLITNFIIFLSAFDSIVPSKLVYLEGIFMRSLYLRQAK